MAQTPDQKRALIAKLEPGDQIGVRSETIMGKIIRFYTGNVNHVATYLGNNLLIEAVAIIAIQHVNEYVLDDAVELYCCKPRVSSAEKQKVANWMMSTLATGRFYGYRGIIGLLFRFWIQRQLWRISPLFRWSGPNRLAQNDNYWCSEASGIGYQQINFKFTDEDVTWLTPEEIYNSPNCDKVTL